MKLAVSSAWTPEERIEVASVLLGLIQNDIYAGKYSEIGRPNITSVQYILHLPAAELEAARAGLEVLLADVPDPVSATLPTPG